MMAALNTTTVKLALAGLKDRLLEIVEVFPDSGNVLPRIRYAEDLAAWLKIAAVKKVNNVQVVRCVFIYLQGWETQVVEGRNTLISPTFAIEIIQGFEDGTDLENSTLTFEGYLADLLDHFIKSPDLGFTEGTDVRHTGLQGTDGDNRPQYVDGILAHRKLATVTINFKYC